jgi:hypothetical protein
MTSGSELKFFGNIPHDVQDGSRRLTALTPKSPLRPRSHIARSFPGAGSTSIAWRNVASSASRSLSRFSAVP